MKKEVKLYNDTITGMLLIWMIGIFPSMWFILLFINFVIYSLVVFISMKKMDLKNKKEIYKFSILKIWILGSISNYIGVIVYRTVFSTISSTYKFNWGMKSGIFNSFMNKLVNATINPINNPYSFLLVTIAIVVAAMFIYIFNYNFSFKKVYEGKYISREEKKKLSLILAIFTAPYLFYLPMTL